MMTPSAIRVNLTSHRTGTQPSPIDEWTLDNLLSWPAATGRKHRHKDVLRRPVVSSGDSAVVYVKRQWAWDRRLPRWSDWRDGVAGLTDPAREYSGLKRLRSIGLHVASPLKLLQDPVPRSPRAAVVIAEVPVQFSLAELSESGRLAHIESIGRRALAQAVADMADRIHRSGLRWRSMKAKHIYPRQMADGVWDLWLIDCEGVRTGASRRQQRRDRRLLVRSLAGNGAGLTFVQSVASALGVA